MERGSDGAPRQLELDPLSASPSHGIGVDGGGGASKAPQSMQDLLSGQPGRLVHSKRPAEGHEDKARADGDSPESGSLYSDENEIPSGYNSGEQYDTLSTGYMSGEAYELPDTRLELHEPALDVIEECIRPLSGNKSRDQQDDYSDANIFVPPTAAASSLQHHYHHHHYDKKDKNGDNASVSSTSTSTSDQEGGAGNESFPRNAGAGHDVEAATTAAARTRSPSYNGSVKTKARKPMASLSVPMEVSPLARTLAVGSNFDPESSDAGGAPTGGYRAMASDTDTSAFDSDANAVMGADIDADANDAREAGHPSDSGAEEILLTHGSHRPRTKSERLAARKAKKMRKHDEEWFNANDNKWWVMARQACFWTSIFLMVASTVAAAIMIYFMPRQCDPPHEWYQGKVILSLSPKGNPAKIDLQTLTEAIDHYTHLGVQTLHLKGLHGEEPTERFLGSYSRATGLDDKLLRESLSGLTDKLHAVNMTLMAEIKVKGEDENNVNTIGPDLSHAVTKAVKFWATTGVDGIFLANLENFAAESIIKTHLSMWNETFEKYSTSPNKRVLMASHKFIEGLKESTQEAVLSHLALLDATLETSDDVAAMSQHVSDVTAWDVTEGRPWINWNLRDLAPNGLPLTKAHLAFQFFLPGTISVEEVDLNSKQSEGTNNSLSRRADQRALKELSGVRTVAVPIFMNGNYRRCECPDQPTGFEKEVNFILKSTGRSGGNEVSGGKLIQIERFYSRRNRYVLVANFGETESNLSSVARVYSTGELLVDTTGDNAKLGQIVDIKDLVLPAGHAFVLKLPL